MALGAAPLFEQTDVFVSGQNGYAAYRIPALETAPDGTLLAFAEARKHGLNDPGYEKQDIDLVLKRSTDQGRTWSSMQLIEDPGEFWSAANPSTIVDRETKKVWLFYLRAKPGSNTYKARPRTDDIQIFARQSGDNGITWSDPMDLTPVAKDLADPKWRTSVVGPGGGIQTHDGKLAVPVWRFEPWNVFALVSEDHGATWRRGDFAPQISGDECQLVELADGRLLLDVRQQRGPHRWRTTSSDFGRSWSQPKPGEKVTPVCCAIERYTLKSRGADRDRLLWAGPKGQGRSNLVIRVSYDEAATFPHERMIATGPAAYSDLAVLQDRTVGVLFERGPRNPYQFITFARVNREWLEDSKEEWRQLPLIANGKIDTNWVQIGWGGMAVEQGMLRTECDPRGLGLLVYKKERLGNCQIRVVFKSKEPKSNAGVYVRMADGILDQVGRPGAAFDRDAKGKISPETMELMKGSSEQEEGPWYAVHYGYEVQIADAMDPFHRTGAIYSLAPSSAVSKKRPDEWKTMIITLEGDRVLVDVEGERVTTFDPASPEVPKRKAWFEPKREPKRPEAGYIGLQNHDPGDVVWYKEVSVKPLERARPTAQSKPNILHIHADDYRADGLRALGNRDVQTPHLDSLVERGMTFASCYTMGSMHGAVCTPSRTMLLTGRSWQRIPNAPDALPNATNSATFLPKVMAAAGYQTWHMGKSGNAFTPGIQAFETNIVENGNGESRAYSSKRLADRTVEFLQARAAAREKRPFYMYLAPPVPHDPRLAEPRFHKLYDPEKVALSPAFLPQHPWDNGEMTVRDEQLAPWPRTPENTRRQLADYYACLTGLDHHIGRIFEALKASGQWENTIIVFTGDNGLSLGEHGLFGKQNLYEFGGMHVPCVVAGPGVMKGRSDALIYLLDLFPTFAELGGATLPEGVEGKSLAPLLRGDSAKPRKALYTAYRDCQRAIRDDRWKLIRYPLVDKTQLFDLKEDPRELNNLAEKPEHAAKVKEMMQLLQEEMNRYADNAPLHVPNPKPAEWRPPAKKNRT